MNRFLVRINVRYRDLPIVVLVASAASLCSAAYTCPTKGKIIISDRPIPDCPDGQRVVQPSGVSTPVQRPLSLADRDAIAQCERKRDEVAQGNKNTARADQDLVDRYPTEQWLSRSRDAELSGIHAGFDAANMRLARLAKERKSLDDEAEFYPGQPLPPKLKRDIDANDAAVTAEKQIQAKLNDDEAQVDARFDSLSARLRILWTGAKPPYDPLPDCSLSQVLRR
jgi:hypothetical protein